MKIIKYGIMLMVLIILIPIGTAYTIIPRPTEVSTITEDELKEFLTNNQVDKNLYTEQYDCGWFARDLIKDAKEQDIILGGASFTNQKNFQGMGHAMNYINILNSNNEIVLVIIEPQSDDYYPVCFEIKYRYLKLYPAGDIPSQWGGGKHYDIDIQNLEDKYMTVLDEIIINEVIENIRMQTYTTVKPEKYGIIEYILKVILNMMG